MPRNITVVDYFGAQNKSRCGYCTKTNTSHSHGMWAHFMTAADYQDLIDRGWRRSGQYCYKPNNKETCCPSYTIKCDAKDFRLSKSHKKILKKMNTYLQNGIRSTNSIERHTDVDTATTAVAATSSAFSESHLISVNQPKEKIDINKVLNSIEIFEEKNVPTQIKTESINEEKGLIALQTKAKMENKIIGPDPTKPLKQKAKVIRAQRKLEKQKQKLGLIDALELPSQSKGQTVKRQEQLLKQLIDAVPEQSHHKLKVKLVPSNDAATEAALNLYRRYQIKIHNDPPAKITRKSFEDFLIRTPLQITLVNVLADSFNENEHKSFQLYKSYQTNIHHDPPESVDEYLDFLCKSPLKQEKPANGPSCGYGSFHQQYWLDNCLIAVGVIDILPKCISSVYFFYDPDYHFLSLGTYGTIRELHFVQELNETDEQLSEYYMGFYIHSCPKMRYKGKLKPSYLLCPEVYTWHLLSDDILNQLDNSKYLRFNKDPNAVDINRFNATNDLDDVRLLVDYKYAMKYREYKLQLGDDDRHSSNTKTEYGELVGKILSKRLYLTA